MVAVPASYVVNPYLNASFVLQIGGFPFGNFAECTGLAAEAAVEEYAEGGENRFAHKFPARQSYPNLVLKRGADITTHLWDWFETWHDTGQVDPKDGTILLMSTVEGVPLPVKGWSFSRGWPVKMAGPDLNALAPAVALESIEIVHRGIRSIRTGL